MTANHPTPPMTFAATLKSERTRLGLTQAQTAALLSVSKRTVEQWEAGRTTPHRYMQDGVLRELREQNVVAEPISSILGMPCFVMENQTADAWAISDPHIAAAYRKGEISEDALKRYYERVVELRASLENVSVEAPNA